MTENKDLSRQSFLGASSTEVLSSARVAIVGLGGGGSHIAQQLAHVGVGEIRLLDPQKIEASNLNRLIGATQVDVTNETAKVDIAKRSILGIRPEISVIEKQTDWQSNPQLLAGVHVIFGCVDGYEQRLYLEAAARKYGVPYIDIGMDVTRLPNEQFAIAGQMIMSLPGCPCMRCIGFLTQDKLNREEDLYGDVGINPQVVWTNGTLASLAVGTFIRLVCPWFAYDRRYEWLELDGNSQTVVQSRQPQYVMPPECPHFTNEDLGDPFFKISRPST